MGCVIGILLVFWYGQDSESFICIVDIVMYNVKESGCGQFCVFLLEMNQCVFDYYWLDINL